MTLKTYAKKPRLPQRSRVSRDQLPGFRVTARDHEVLSCLLTHRILTPQHISDLVFVSPHLLPPPPPPTSRCLHRLKLLYQYGLLERHEIPQILSQGRRPFVYSLTREGAEMLALSLGVALEELGWRGREQIGPLFLEHQLAINDVVVAWYCSAKRHGFVVQEYRDDRVLKRNQQDVVTLTNTAGRPQKASVVPDGYFHLIAGDAHYHQFLEVDRQTVTGISATWGRRTWARKVSTYLAYYRSGLYHERYKTKSMRVLTVTTSKTRLEHLKAITEETGGASRFWFTTRSAVLTHDLLVDPIWEVAHREGVHTLTW